MQTILSAILPILPILIALSFGYVFGRCVPAVARTRLGKFITPLVWLLLFSIGKEFGGVLNTSSSIAHTLQTAALFSALTTLVPWIMILALSRGPGRHENYPSRIRSNLSAFAAPLKECSIALLMVAGGVFVFATQLESYFVGLWFPSTTALLYFLIFLVGVDVVGVKLDSTWFSSRTLLVPLLVVIGSLLGGIIASVLSGQPVGTSLALSSGFGWFTLSGVLVGKHLGDSYGAIALLTDLFRELLAIVLLYSVGIRFPRACIGASGATALDSTLPIIKQTCGAIDLPTALVSGFLLTLLAPFLITFFLAG